MFLKILYLQIGSIPTPNNHHNPYKMIAVILTLGIATIMMYHHNTIPTLTTYNNILDLIHNVYTLVIDLF